MKVVTGQQQPEAYVDRKEMARRLGVSVTTLDDMVRKGQVPSVTWGRRTRRFLPSVVIAHLGWHEAGLHTEEAA